MEGGDPMPKEWTDCIKATIADGKSKDSAYAICTAAFIKRHGITPQEAEKKESGRDRLVAIYLQTGNSVKNQLFCEQLGQQERIGFSGIIKCVQRHTRSSETRQPSGYFIVFAREISF